jgi:hypothetical protein
MVARTGVQLQRWYRANEKSVSLLTDGMLSWRAYYSSLSFALPGKSRRQSISLSPKLCVCYQNCVLKFARFYAEHSKYGGTS